MKAILKAFMAIILLATTFTSCTKETAVGQPSMIEYKNAAGHQPPVLPAQQAK